MRFKVLTAMKMLMLVFGVVKPYSHRKMQTFWSNMVLILQTITALPSTRYFDYILNYYLKAFTNR